MSVFFVCLKTELFQGFCMNVEEQTCVSWLTFADIMVVCRVRLIFWRDHDMPGGHAGLSLQTEAIHAAARTHSHTERMRGSQSTAATLEHNTPRQHGSHTSHCAGRWSSGPNMPQSPGRGFLDPEPGSCSLSRLAGHLVAPPAEQLSYANDKADTEQSGLDSGRLCPKTDPGNGA